MSDLLIHLKQWQHLNIGAQPPAVPSKEVISSAITTIYHEHAVVSLRYATRKCRACLHGCTLTFLNASLYLANSHKKSSLKAAHSGGESGIRTRDRLFTYTRFPGVLLQPLGHLTKT